jgi:cell fate (sporulation/competence/biofilm development) regulator YlbF (YheA/YmcA/DUF963 family)
MRVSNVQSVSPTEKGAAAAIEAARALGRALGESSAFKQFEAAYEVLQSDTATRRKLEDFESRQREIRLAARWGGADAQEQSIIEQEWQSISATSSLGGYLRAQEELAVLFREAVRRISEQIGVDYGAACSPSGGCC